MDTSTPWPEEIRLAADKHSLTVAFDDGSRFTIAAELLRVRSPSAEVQGHTPDQRVTVAKKRNVTIRAIEPVGAYAVRLVFDDGHGSGLYTWGQLYDFGVRQDELFAEYVAELSAKGMSR